ncbi:hypothetical protein [Luteolibacter sp. Populi]|uniref:hypothetical protein n=1 Tax=Luteolibacter sp. Populi TaxID=3230487 RepID=UPI003465062F
MPAAFFLLMAYGIFLAPSIDRARYKSKWIERFSDYRGGGAIPAEWKDEVGRRSLPSGEWILAAMHHGVCAPGPEGTFDASVILDSSGSIFYRDWSPCAGGVSNGVRFWESELEPTISLADLHGHRTKWLRAAP